MSAGDGSAWLEGDAAWAIVCDAMVIPVVVGDVDPGAVNTLIGLCVQYDRIRAHLADRPPDLPDGPDAGEIPAGPDSGADVRSMLEHQILATVTSDAGPGVLRCTNAAAVVARVAQYGSRISGCELGEGA